MKNIVQNSNHFSCCSDGRSDGIGCRPNSMCIYCIFVAELTFAHWCALLTTFSNWTPFLKHSGELYHATLRSSNVNRLNRWIWYAWHHQNWIASFYYFFPETTIAFCFCLVDFGWMRTLVNISSSKFRGTGSFTALRPFVSFILFVRIIPRLNFCRSPKRIRDSCDDENYKCDPEHWLPFLNAFLLDRVKSFKMQLMGPLNLKSHFIIRSLLTCGVNMATTFGASVPVIAPILFETAITVEAKFGLKSNGLTFMPGYHKPMNPIPSESRTRINVSLRPTYEAPTRRAPGIMAPVKLENIKRIALRESENSSIFTESSEQFTCIRYCYIIFVDNVITCETTRYWKDPHY